MNRRQFAMASLFPATLLGGCHSGQKPARDATLFHNERVRDAVSELDQAINALDMQIGLANAENWRDVLASIQTAAIRTRNDVDELKRTLGYTDAS